MCAYTEAVWDAEMGNCDNKGQMFSIRMRNEFPFSYVPRVPGLLEEGGKRERGCGGEEPSASMYIGGLVS